MNINLNKDPSSYARIKAVQVATWHPTEVQSFMELVLQDIQKMAAEIEFLEGLLDDKDYLRIKADYNKGHLSYAGQIEARERR